MKVLVLDDGSNNQDVLQQADDTQREEDLSGNQQLLVAPSRGILLLYRKVFFWQSSWAKAPIQIAWDQALLSCGVHIDFF